MFNNILPFVEANRNLFATTSPLSNNTEKDSAAQMALWKLGHILAQTSSTLAMNQALEQPFSPTAIFEAMSRLQNPSVAAESEQKFDFENMLKNSINNMLAQMNSQMAQAANTSNLFINQSNSINEHQSSHESGIFSNSTTTPPPMEELQYSTSSSTGSPLHENLDQALLINTSSQGTASHNVDHSSANSTGSKSSSKKSGFQAGITVGYTYDAFFVSDGRSKRRKSASNISQQQNLNKSQEEIVLNQNNSATGSSENSLIMNLCNERVDEKKSQRYSCSECGKHYATSSNLSRHKQTHRSLDSKMAKKCPHCGKAYVSMPALSMHILTHDLRHQCDICGKAFSRPWLLQGHRRAHTGEKPYGCAHCGRAFADRSNLRAHMQIHSQMKQFQCYNCDKGFILKSYLTKHLETCIGAAVPMKEDQGSEQKITKEIPLLPFSLSIASLVDG